MKSLFKNFKNWCNGNQGLLAAIAIVVAIIPLIGSTNINFNKTGSFLNNISRIVIYQINIPIYLLLIILIATALLVLSIKRRFYLSSGHLRILIGKWETKHESFEITKDSKYFINKQHWFDVHWLHSHSKKKEIIFIKIPVNENDSRRLINILKVTENGDLEGTENGIPIKYVKK
jgi:hypothetical protein